MICFIFAGKVSSDGVNNYFNDNFILPLFWALTTSIVLYIGFGFLMGLDYLLKERAKEGKWRINVSKLIIIGVPSLVFGFMFYIIFLFHIPTSIFPRVLFSENPTYMILFKILLGYTIATSFYKERSMKPLRGRSDAQVPEIPLCVVVWHVPFGQVKTGSGFENFI